MVRASEGGPFFGLIFTAIIGTNRAYPELIPEHILNDKGREKVESVKDACVGDNGVGVGEGVVGARGAADGAEMQLTGGAVQPPAGGLRRSIIEPRNWARAKSTISSSIWRRRSGCSMKSSAR